MLVVAYVLFVLGALASWRTGRFRTRPAWWLSALQALVAASMVAAGLAIFAEADAGGIAPAVGVVLAVGGVSYIVALPFPDSPRGRSARLGAAVLATAGLAVPSTLTLALPAAWILYWGTLGAARSRALSAS